MHGTKQEGTEPGQNAKYNQRGTNRPNEAPTTAHTRQNDTTRTDESLKTVRTAPEEEEEDEECQGLWIMTTLVEDIREKLPIKTIPNIIGEPTYKAINELREALYANGSAIPTALRGGTKFPHWSTDRWISI